MTAMNQQAVAVVTYELTSNKSNGIKWSIMKMWEIKENGYLLSGWKSNGNLLIKGFQSIIKTPLFSTNSCYCI